MSQQRFDTAEFLASNKTELLTALKPELVSILETKPWFVKHDLAASYEEAFSDWVVYKIQWLYIDNTGKSFEEVSTVIDKGFVADIYGEDVLKSGTWEK